MCLSVPPPQLVILDIPDSGAYYVYDGDHVDTEMIRTFIGLFLCLCPLTLLRCICCMRERERERERVGALTLRTFCSSTLTTFCSSGDVLLFFFGMWHRGLRRREAGAQGADGGGRRGRGSKPRLKEVVRSQPTKFSNGALTCMHACVRMCRKGWVGGREGGKRELN
jgi:hypothetical protein